MYRSVTLACLRANVEITNNDDVLRIARQSNLEQHDEKFFLNGEDVSREIREPEVTASVKQIADNQSVRQWLVKLQRHMASRGNLVTEGRDQATVAFPNADVKIFLTATPEERARRRQQQLEKDGVACNFDSILQSQNLRDAEDESREFGGLAKADNAIELLTDGLTCDQIVDRLQNIVRQKCPQAFAATSNPSQH